MVTKDSIIRLTTEVDTSNPIHEVRKVKIILFVLSLVALLQSLVVSGNLTVSLSTIEKAFNYNSKEVGSIILIYNITSAITCLLIGYLVKIHKKRIIATAPILIAVGCFIFIIPVFIKIKYEIYASKASDLCSKIPKNSTIGLCPTSPYYYLSIMYLGYFFIAIGAAIIYSIGLDYIDEICLPSNSGLYHAIFYATSALGPSFSFFFSKLIFKLYIDPTVKDLQIDSESETWIGAYWILYFIGGILSFILGFVVLIIPGPPNMRIKSKPDRIEESIFPVILKNTNILIKNVPYISVILGNMFDGIVFNSFANFASKHIQFQFSINAGSAGMYVGAITVGGGSCAMIVGGIILKRFKFTLEKLCAFNMTFNILSLSFMLGLFIHCPNIDIHGVKNYNTSEELMFQFRIANKCNCDIKDFLPVCDGIKNYYSPCSIGCEYKIGQPGKYLYYNCTYLKNLNHEVTQGFCATKCKYFWLFILLFFVSVWCQMLLTAPELRYIIRTVKEEHILFALSFGQFIFRLGTIIGPLLFGVIFDYTCDIFQPLSCKSSSNCIKYDLPNLSFIVAITCVILKFISVILQIHAYFFIRRNNFENIGDGYTRIKSTIFTQLHMEVNCVLMNNFF